MLGDGKLGVCPILPHTSVGLLASERVRMDFGEGANGKTKSCLPFSFSCNLFFYKPIIYLLNGTTSGTSTQYRRKQIRGCCSTKTKKVSRTAFYKLPQNVELGMIYSD